MISIGKSFCENHCLEFQKSMRDALILKVDELKDLCFLLNICNLSNLDTDYFSPPFQEAACSLHKIIHFCSYVEMQNEFPYFLLVAIRQTLGFPIVWRFYIV
uniref:Putative MO25-like protein At5g47540 isoform X2 n=1 Tax=Rhizophora mucronata TaxID=61149 RepID=A0A2P2MFG5_RHIMU